MIVARPDKLHACLAFEGGSPTLNVAGNTHSITIASAPGSEADLEKRLAGANPAELKSLMSALGLVKLDRQMPVGVFDGPPTRKGAIFTGGKSAIDLIGTDESGGLWLLELKTKSNIKVGAISELFFYSMVLLDAQHGRIKFYDTQPGSRCTITPKEIKNAFQNPCTTRNR